MEIENIETIYNNIPHNNRSQPMEIDDNVQDNNKMDIENPDYDFISTINNTMNYDNAMHWKTPLQQEQYKYVCLIVANKYNIDISKLRICCGGCGIQYHNNNYNMN